MVLICFSRLSRRVAQDVQDGASRCDFIDLFDSRWGGVEKMKKNLLLAGEVSSTVKIAFPRRARIKKKVIPMQHGSAEIEFCDTSSARTLVLLMMYF